jgi:hypothetical protein
MTWEEKSGMCGQWGQEQILDHLQGRLPAAESDRFRAHAASCSDCRASIEELTLVAGLATAAPVRPGREAEAAVLAVLRREAARRKPPTRRRLRRVAGTPDSAAWAWVLVGAAVFMVALVSAIVSSAPAPKPAVVRSEPTPPPPVEDPPRPQAPPSVTPPKPPPEPFLVPPKPEPPPVEPPKPLPTPPPVEPPPKPPTIAEPKPAAVEIARVVRASGRYAIGDKILAGDPVQCSTGVLILETADKSQVALKAGTTVTGEAQGDHLTFRITDGELACSVKTRPERRFVVAAAHGSVTVKGTIFGVRVASLGAVVTVAKGRVEARNDVGAQEVGSGERCSMSRSTSPGRPEAVNADKLLTWAYDAGLPSPGTMWILAGSGDLQAPMTRARIAGSIGEAIHAAVDSRTLPGWNGRFLASNAKEGGWATFTVDLPEAGTWHLWGRFFNPGSGSQLWKQDGEPKDNDPNSFFVSVDGGKEFVFGNHKLDPETKASGYRRWYWGGDGTIEVGRPGALPLGTLSKGRHTIRIRNRDAVETSSLHLAPRLDVLCLTPDRDYRPRDEDFRK